MRRKRRIFQHRNIQGYPLRKHIELHHPLVELADMIDWAAIDRVANESFQPGSAGRFCARVSSPDCSICSMRSSHPMNRSWQADWRTRIGQSSPARRICKPNRQSTRQAWRAGASD
jgi:hypothetical protein